jgi:hypothetical protein
MGIKDGGSEQKIEGMGRHHKGGKSPAGAIKPESIVIVLT